MTYKKYEYDSFRIFAVETDQFKNCHIEVVFQGDATKQSLTESTFLSEMISFTSKQFPTRKEFMIRLEELYNAYLYSVTTKVGKTLLTNFVFDFLDPQYVTQKEYLQECLSFLFDVLMHPNVKNQAFDLKAYQIIQSHLKSDIQSMKENPTTYALRRSLQELFPNSISSKNILGNLEELKEISPESLGVAYEKMWEENYCDIYIIGNLNMDQISKMILKLFQNPVIKTHPNEIYVGNPKVRKCKKVVEEGKFVQSNLVVAYQMQDFIQKDYDAVLSVFQEIFCGSSLNSKLYQYLRNDHSLCYRIQTVYQKYDGALLIAVGLQSQHKDLAVKLIQKAMKEMAKGEFTDEEIEMAKKQLSFAIKMSFDNQNSIINNYVFHNLAKVPLLKERQKLIQEVTKADIMKLAKKLKLGLVYELKENGHEEDSSKGLK